MRLDDETAQALWPGNGGINQALKVTGQVLFDIGERCEDRNATIIFHCEANAICQRRTPSDHVVHLFAERPSQFPRLPKGYHDRCGAFVPRPEVAVGVDSPKNVFGQNTRRHKIISKLATTGHKRYPAIQEIMRMTSA